MDIYDSEFYEKILLYIFFGILDAMWQTAAYWLMGAMSNDPAKLAHFAGFCMLSPLVFLCCILLSTSLTDKSLQSAGAAGVWRADAVKVP